MRNFTRSHKKTARELNRRAGELNGLLLVLAVGLAVLDATCMTALRIGDISGFVNLSIHAPVEPSSVNEIAR